MSPLPGMVTMDQRMGPPCPRATTDHASRALTRRPSRDELKMPTEAVEPTLPRHPPSSNRPNASTTIRSI